MENTEELPFIITTSDVHLGGGASHPDLFEKFLKEILKSAKRNKHKEKKIKVLLILGDIFDVMMSTFETISREFIHILKLLDQIYEQGIRIIITLGNHEVSVTGDWDKEFTPRKIEFINTFQNILKEYDYKAKFLNKRNFCQYVTLTNNTNKPEPEWELNLFDSKYQIPNKMPNNLRPIIIGKSTTTHPFKFIFCHGYQFFKAESKSAGEVIWNPLFKSSPTTKDRINTFYNKIGVRNIVKKTTSIGKEIWDSISKQWEKEMKKKEEKTKKNDGDEEEYPHQYAEDKWGKSQDHKDNQRYDVKEPEETKKGKIKKFGRKTTRFFKGVGKDIKKIAKKGYKGAKGFINKDFYLGTLTKMIKTDEVIQGFKKIQDMDQRVIKFIEKDFFREINHVIFGHTHVKSRSLTEGKVIVNDGAWQHVEPSYVKIFPNGTIIIQDYN